LSKFSSRSHLIHIFTHYTAPKMPTKWEEVK
jgi:hypothetical protein